MRRALFGGAVMKPGMQRDILVTLWLLFDDLMDDPQPAAPPPSAIPEVSSEESAPPPANHPSKRYDP